MFPASLFGSPTSQLSTRPHSPFPKGLFIILLALFSIHLSRRRVTARWKTSFALCLFIYCLSYAHRAEISGSRTVIESGDSLINAQSNTEYGAFDYFSPLPSAFRCIVKRCTRPYTKLDKMSQNSSQMTEGTFRKQFTSSFWVRKKDLWMRFVAEGGNLEMSTLPIL